MLASILEPVTYYGGLLLFLAAFVLTVSHGSHGFPVAEAGREACHLYSMALTEIEGEGTRDRQRLWVPETRLP